MNNFGYDDVRGVVVGDVASVSAMLTYEGRPQSTKEFFSNEKQAIIRMREIKNAVKRDCGSIVGYIFPDESAWQIKISNL